MVDSIADSGRAGDEPLTFLLARLGDTDPLVRAGAAWSLGKLSTARAVQPLRAAIHDNDWRVRVNAAASLARLNQKTVDDALAELVSDKLGYVRANAVLGMARIHSGATFTRVLQKIRFDRNPWVRLNLLRTAKNHKIQNLVMDTGGAYRSWGELVKAVASQDPDSRVRTVARQLLRPKTSKGQEWIGLYPLDQNRKPVRNKDVILVLPDGLVKAARTDANGELWEEGLVPGRCHLEAPTLDLFAPPTGPKNL